MVSNDTLWKLSQYTKLTNSLTQLLQIYKISCELKSAWKSVRETQWEYLDISDLLNYDNLDLKPTTLLYGDIVVNKNVIELTLGWKGISSSGQMSHS